MSLSVVAAARPARGMKVVAKAAGAAKGKMTNIETFVKGGLVGAVDPFPQGLDLFGFCNGADDKTVQRYREAELTHGRVSMLAALGFLVGEAVEGSSFLFDSQVTGPAINHFQQVPGLFWGLLGATIFLAETTRIQVGWADPFVADKAFLLKDGYEPGNLEFDPLGLSAGKDAAWLSDMRNKELNNGRLAMIAISGMVAQELVNGLNILPADEVLEMGKSAELKEMIAECAGTVNEAACAKAFEDAERLTTFTQSL